MTASALVARSDGSMAGALRALANAGPLHQQNLMLISLEAIHTALSDRWDAKRDQIWNQVEKFLRHEFGPADLVLRLDELTVLVAQPDRTRMAAQTRCIQAAHDLLRFFLGDATAAAGAVKTVIEVRGDTIACAPVPAEQIAAVAAARDPERWAPCASVRCPILTPIGRPLFVDMALAPILTLQAGRHAGGFAGYSIRTGLVDADNGQPLDAHERDALRACDLASVDVVVLATAFAERRAAPQPTAPLVVPISSHTLAQSSGRYALLEAVHRLAPDERRRLVLELVDLEPGTPRGRLCELIAMARPHCRGVICQMEPTATHAETLRSAGATLSLRPEPEPPSEAGLLRQAPAYAAAAKLTHALMLHDLPLELAPVAALAGATHCTLRPSSAAIRVQAT